MTASLAVLGWCERVAAVGVIVSASEWLALSDVWGEGGPCAWTIVGQHRVNRGTVSTVTAPLFGPTGTRNLLLLQVLGAVAVLVPAGASWHVAALAVTVLALLSLQRRLVAGHDGSDGLVALTLTAALLARLMGTAGAATGVLWFLALQPLLTYTASGWGKLRERDWRSGMVLRDVMSSVLFGTPRLAARLERRPQEAAWLSRLVIATMVSFPLVFVLPRPLALGLLAATGVFHIGTAVVMGLTRFPWAFMATYPAVVHCARI
jgi:hypothetical protein